MHHNDDADGDYDDDGGDVDGDNDDDDRCHLHADGILVFIARLTNTNVGRALWDRP